MSEPRKREEKIGPSLRRQRGHVERDEREEDGTAREEGVKREESLVVETNGRRTVDRHKGEEKSERTVKEGEKSRARKTKR